MRTTRKRVRARGARCVVRLKRAYEPHSPGDGMRVLVDRLWPRGLSRAVAAIDRWEREVAPSTELRRWYGHDVERWRDFRERYERELEDRAELLDELLALEREHGILTLLYAARDEEHNEAVVLADVLRRRGGGEGHASGG